MDESNHSTVLFTVHYQPSRIVIDPGSAGEGDEVEYYPVTDVQGTVYKLLDTSGVEVADYTYSPFGERLTNSAPTIYMPLGFGGTYSDDEIGLLYAKSRYYDPHTTRFTTKDSYRGSKTSIISQNRYIYCHQNPIKYADPAGYAPIEGDRADPCTTTDQDIHYEPTPSELAPPEDLPNSSTAVLPDGTFEEHDGKSYFIPDGFIDNGDGSFDITIAGIRVTVQIDVTDGSPKVTFAGSEFYPEGKNQYNSLRRKSQAIANGLNDAFSAVPMLNDLFYANPEGFTSILNDFYDEHYSEWHASYGGDSFQDYQRFFFSATIGYAIASEMTNGVDVPAGSAIEAWTKRLGMSLFDLTMMHGFWATFHNSEFSEGYYHLTKVFNSGGDIHDPNTVAGLVQITAYSMTFHYYLSNAGVGWDDIKSKIAKNEMSFTQVLGAILNSTSISTSVGSFLLGLAGITGGTALGGIGLAFAVASILIGAGGDNGFKINNDTLFTSGMYNTCRQNGLNTVYGIGGARYDMNSFFMQAGLMQHWTSMEYNEHGLGKGTMLGHIVDSFMDYIDTGIYLGPGSSVEDYQKRLAKYTVLGWFFGREYLDEEGNDPSKKWDDWAEDNL